MRGTSQPSRGSRYRPFDTIPPSARQVQQALVLDAVAERARGRQERVLEREARELDRQAAAHEATPPRARRTPGPRCRRMRHLGRLVRSRFDADHAAEAGADAAAHPGIEAHLGREAARLGHLAPPRAAWRRGRRRRGPRGPASVSRYASQRHGHAAVHAPGCRRRSRAPAGRRARSGSRPAAGRPRCGRRRRPWNGRPSAFSSSPNM